MEPHLTQSPFAVYTRLVRDRRLSHGAFRLWHALRAYSDAKGGCFPGQRRLSEDIGCNIHSVKPWLEELLSAGYLRCSQRTKGERTHYTLLDGDPAGATPLRKVASVGVAQNGNGVLPKVATPSVAESGNITNTRELIPLTNGKPVSVWELTKKKEAKEALLKRIHDRGWEDAWGTQYANENDREQARTLKKEIHELERQLAR